MFQRGILKSHNWSVMSAGLEAQNYNYELNLHWQKGRLVTVSGASMRKDVKTAHNVFLVR